MGYIYKITNLINGKEYIGKTELTIEDRFKRHIIDSRKENNEKRPLYNAFNKYGIENFIVEEIEKCNDEELNLKEEYWIDYYNTYSNGYNATKGGDGKTLINYEEILFLYNDGLTLKEIKEKTGHDIQWISKILQSKGISAEDIQRRKVKNQEKQVFMKDKDTNEILNIFKSVAEASNFIKENGYSTGTPNGIGSHICQCCNGIRKSAYKFNWSYTE